MPVVGVPLLEAICWDHDRFGKDYLGEFDIALEDIFADGEVNQPVGEGTRCSDIWGPTLTFSSSPIAQMVHSEFQAEDVQKEGQHCVG